MASSDKIHVRSFIKDLVLRELLGCGDDLPAWFDQLEESFLIKKFSSKVCPPVKTSYTPLLKTVMKPWAWCNC